MSKKTVVPELLTLRQAVLWIALDLPPLERRLEIAANYPRQIAYASALEGLDEAQRTAITAAKSQLVGDLIEDRLRVLGRAQVHNGGEVFIGRDGQPMIIDPDAHDRPRTEIPPTWLEPDGIDWDRDRAGSLMWPEQGQVVAYIDVRLRTADVRRLRQRRLRAQPEGRQIEPARRGPKPIYDEAEFYRLLAWELEANGAPKTQEELINRMQVLLALVWGEGNAPEKSWLKERTGPLYATRPLYEQARQAMEHQAD